MRAFSHVFAVVAVALCGCPLSAQTFDAASIKPNDSSKNPGVLSGATGPGSPTRHRYIGSLQAFIGQAYNVQDFQISGGPKWIDSDMFEIYATSAPASQGQINLMLQALLTDRFKLTLHRETKQLPVYDLVLAKDEPKFRRGDDTGTSEGEGFLRGTMDMSAFAQHLTEILGRTVLDGTELKGAWQIALKWTPDNQTAAADNPAPSIFTAVKEQLGLQLKASRGPVPVLVIDRAEKPSAN